MYHVFYALNPQRRRADGKKPEQVAMGIKRKYYLAILLSLIMSSMALTASAAFARNGGTDNPPRANGKGTTGSDGAAIFKG
jgi:hypothetical protein